MKSRILIIALALSPWGFSFTMDIKHQSELKIEQKKIKDVVLTAASKTVALKTKPRVKHSLPLCIKLDAKKSHITQPKDIKKWNSPATQKVALFRTMLANPQRNLKALYTLAHDPVIKQHIKDSDIFKDLLAFIKVPADDLPANADAKNQKDVKEQQDELDQCIAQIFPPTQAKTILEYAIDANDAPFIGFMQSHLNDQQRLDGVRYAAHHKKSQALLALIPKDSQTGDHQAIQTFFIKQIKDLTLPEANGLEAALALCTEYKKLRSCFAKKSLTAISEQTSLLNDAHNSILEMLYPLHSQNPKQMHAALQQAITANNLDNINLCEDFNFDARTASSPEESELTPHHLNKDGMDALELAAHSLHAATLRRLFGPYIPAKKQQRLEDIATQALHEKYPPRSPDALLEAPKKTAEQEELEKKYNETMLVLEEELPALQEQSNRKLIEAFTQGDTGKILLSLKKGANPNCTFDNGEPIFYMAQSNFCKILLAHGANPNSSYRLPAEAHPVPMIYHTLIETDTNRLSMLLEHGASPNVPIINPQGSVFSMLHCAMFKKKPGHFKILLEYGANPHATTRQKTPLTFEAFDYDASYLDALLEVGADPHVGIKASNQDFIYSLLEWSWMKKKPEHTKILLKYIKPNTLSPAGTPLTFEALFHDPACLDELLANGADPHVGMKAENENHVYSLIEWSWQHKKPEHAKIILKYINPNALSPRGFPLPWEALFYDPSHLDALLEAGFDPHVKLKSKDEDRVYSLLEWSWIKKKPEHTKVILKYIKPNALSPRGYPLTFEALFRDPAYLDELLSHGFDVNAQKLSDKGRSVSLLGWSWNKDKPEHLKILVKHGAKIDIVNSHGHPLVSDALNYHPSWLELLLDSGFDPHVTIKEYDISYSLLEWCGLKCKPAHTKILVKHLRKNRAIKPQLITNPKVIFSYDLESFELLLIEGFIDPNGGPKNADGHIYSLLEQAMDKEKPEHAKLLLKHGARTDTVTQNGQFPLTCLALKLDPLWLELLLKGGFKANIQATFKGKTQSLVQWAYELNKRAHERLLFNHGAQLPPVNCVVQ